MKKNLFYLLSFVLLFSCQVDELEQSDSLNAVYSKSKKNNKDHKKDFQYVCHKLNIGNDWKFITLYLPPEAIEAHLDHGDELGKCPEDDSTDVNNENNGCNCSGNVTRLDLRYNGAEDAVISVMGTKGKKVLYKKHLSPGEMFVLEGFDRGGTLGSEIHLSVKGEENATIDTGCTDPNILGYTYGDFTIEGGSSLNGGEFCQGMVM
ncbi:MAG: hypothetical protein HKP53_02825 [Eudoraea sp.]|nr:hypothetical protein [Eudoraea sp.]